VRRDGGRDSALNGRVRRHGTWLLPVGRQTRITRKNWPDRRLKARSFWRPFGRSYDKAGRLGPQMLHMENYGTKGRAPRGTRIDGAPAVGKLVAIYVVWQLTPGVRVVRHGPDQDSRCPQARIDQGRDQNSPGQTLTGEGRRDCPPPPPARWGPHRTRPAPPWWITPPALLGRGDHWFAMLEKVFGLQQKESRSARTTHTAYYSVSMHGKRASAGPAAARPAPPSSGTSGQARRNRPVSYSLFVAPSPGPVTPAAGPCTVMDSQARGPAPPGEHAQNAQRPGRGQGGSRRGSGVIRFG